MAAARPRSHSAARSPNPDSLTLEPWIVEDHWGNQIELERPSALPLDDSAKTELQLCFRRGPAESLRYAISGCAMRDCGLPLSLGIQVIEANGLFVCMQ